MAACFDMVMNDYTEILPSDATLEEKGDALMRLVKRMIGMDLEEYLCGLWVRVDDATLTFIAEPPKKERSYWADEILFRMIQCVSNNTNRELGAMIRNGQRPQLNPMKHIDFQNKLQFAALTELSRRMALEWAETHAEE